MCILCVEIAKGLITTKEALGATSELIVDIKKEDEEHLVEVREKLLSEYADEISAEVMKNWRQG